MANSTSNIDAILQSQASKEVTANAFFDAASQATTYGRRASTCSGLTWGYYGGNVVKTDNTMTQVGNSTLTLTASATNYIVAAKATGVVSFSTGTTNWDDATNYWRLYSVVTGASTVTSYTDARETAKFTVGSATFTGLTDVPSSYTGHSLKSVRVNTGATGLEFFTPPAPGATAFTGLTDAPASYTGQGLKGVRVNAGATALEFYTPGDATTFVGLTDVPASYSGQALKVVRVNSGATGLEFFTLGAGSGDVVGPASAGDNNVALFDGVTGKTIKDSGLTLAGTNTGDESTTSIGALINSATAKTPPVDADQFGLMDSAAGNILKKLSWANLKAALNAARAPTVSTITYAATISVDLSTVPDGGTFRCTLTGNITVNFTGGTDGQKVSLELKQDATGSRLVALGTGIAYGTDITSFTATTTANKTDLLGIVLNGSAYRLVAVSKGY